MGADWFDPSEDAVIRPSVDQARFWQRRYYGRDRIAVAQRVVYANNGHGRLLDAVCGAMDRCAEVLNDQREHNYCHYRGPSGSVTIYRAPEPAPYAAADLELPQTINPGILEGGATGDAKPSKPKQQAENKRDARRLASPIPRSGGAVYCFFAGAGQTDSKDTA